MNFFQVLKAGFQPEVPAVQRQTTITKYILKLTAVPLDTHFSKCLSHKSQITVRSSYKLQTHRNRDYDVSWHTL